jgi:prolyl-tRNA synthetase
LSVYSASFNFFSSTFAYPSLIKASSSFIIICSFTSFFSGVTVSAIEQNHDDKGIIWPKEIAPFVVDIIVGDVKKENQLEFAEKLYEDLVNAGVKTILDDRNERFGPKIADFELVGFPVGVIVGKKLKDNKVEIRDRKTGEKFEVDANEVFEKVMELINKD